MNGVVNVYKEPGFTSHDVIAVLRGMLRTHRIGHTGTLDPDAEGVLPVCVGKATKAADMIMGSEKRYRAVMAFGSETATQDASGSVTKTYEYEFDEERVRNVCASFVGTFEQVPPMYSAVKVGGMKLYELARMGMEVERRPRAVTVYELKVLSASPEEAEIEVLCSKGAYIRTLCEDIGRRLGYGAHLKTLKRTASGVFTAETSHTLAEIKTLLGEGRPEAFLIPLDRLFDDCPSLRACPGDDRYLQNGNPLSYPADTLAAGPGDAVRMYDSGDRFVGLYKVGSIRDGKVHLTAYKMFGE